MSFINELSSKIYNRIAAGEVVERPASVVKELVENSIDAGSKNILIEISGGGISMISVKDDGSGIEKSQLKKALLPHATSKISKVSDLDNITSLGFRGEALASIASVSKISIVSKPNEQEFGAKIYSEGGNICEVEDFASTKGTEITVNNLFFNTPVRERFLKSEKSEESEISVMIARFILGYPEISFKYIADGKVVLQSFGDGFESAFINVYGVQAIKECYYIDTQKNGITVKGYLGRPEFAKGNRTYQTVFLNGRYVQNQTVSSAIGNAYSSYLMKRKYPLYVLSVDMPFDAVDCNVHPNKIDVRFQNNQIVYGGLYSVVSKVLDGSSEALNMIIEKDEQNTNNIHTNYDTHNEKKQVEIPNETYKFDKLLFNDSVVEIKKESDLAKDIFAENKAYLEALEKKKEENFTQSEIKIERDLFYIGQALNTFLIFEDGEDMYFIDQHAAHERILFDKFNEKMLSNSIDVQPLLFPYVLNVNPVEYDFLRKKIDILNSMGIEIEEFGINTLKISSVPVCIADMDLKAFFNDILEDLNELKEITLNSLLKEKIAQKACKSAIKSGDKLSDDDIKVLMTLIKGNLALKCPHGRPIAIKITRTEIDKWFKRIV